MPLTACSRITVVVLVSLLLLSARSPAADQPAGEAADLAAWEHAKINPVWSNSTRHSIHAYYIHSPESPDGKYVLFYTSGDADGGTGDLRIIERSTGAETIVARNIPVEDAHRGACQQWSNGGKTIVYHDCREKRWFVVAVDLKTLTETILAEDHQLGFGRADQSWIPIYGCHWNPGKFRDLELVNVQTRERKTVVKVEQVVADNGPWLTKAFGDKPISVFFPVMSPDGSKLFFKAACGNGGDDFRTKAASARDGKFVYDLDGHFLRFFENWGHPSWHPDSQGILEKGNILYDVKSGSSQQLVKTPSDHPSFSPDGKFFSSDAEIKSEKEGNWCVVIGSAHTQNFVQVDKFSNTQGATSWRHNHPHPVFSPDGKRLYYNENKGPWTQLYVAEIGQ